MSGFANENVDVTRNTHPYLFSWGKQSQGENRAVRPKISELFLFFISLCLARIELSTCLIASILQREALARARHALQGKFYGAR